MNTVVTLFFILLIVFSVVRRKHKVLFFLVILAVFTDVFSLNLGSIIHLSNVIGFLMLPLIFRFYFNEKLGFITNRITKVFRPLWLNFFYLMILGFIFGFLIPWEDTGGYRMWSQKAQGRTIITLIRAFNEFCVALYIIWAILSGKVTTRYIVTMMGWITLASCIVGIIEFISGYPVIKSIIQSSPKVLPGRVLGLNGEPKSFGRNSALAYIITLAYYIKVEKNKKLLFFISVNVLNILLSMSASTFILFILFNIYIIIDTKRFRLLLPIIPLFLIGYTIVNSNPMFEQTKRKIDKALYGSEDLSKKSQDASFAMDAVSRFDIFDHLAYVFLLNNPKYMITGTGPNLISLPASRYVGDYPQYSTYAEIGGIDSVPNIMFNNVLAASGIVGIILYIIFFVRLYRFSKIDKSGFSKSLVEITLLFSMVYFSIVFLFLTGVIVGVVTRRILLIRKEKKKKLPIKYQTVSIQHN